MWHFYLLLCKNNRFYAGVTNSLEKKHCPFGSNRVRVGSHKTRGILYSESFSNRVEVVRRKLEVSKFSRDEKLELIKLGKIIAV